MTAESICVGIDLGTSHTVVAYGGFDSKEIRVFGLPQLVTRSEIETLPLLPSVLYAPLPDESVADPFGDAPWAIGAFARRRGQEAPGRVVSSAKSWLSHPGIDRKAPVLPWAGTEDPSLWPISPVEASRRILLHLRAAWDRAFPEHPLAKQFLILTVPASFDAVARELTVEAASEAGLKVRLLEEPQAAFYDLIAQAGPERVAELVLKARSESTILVCDVGGGTTDLTLIRARSSSHSAAGPEFERIAVGRHLLLGGDNIDLALAHRLEARWIPPPDRLAPARFSELVQACRAAKEKLLGSAAPPSVPIRIVSRGSSLVGATLSTELGREEVEKLLFEGFLPEIPEDLRLTPRRAGLLAFGLPYEQNPAITHHLASFLGRHSQGKAPDALLLNGGLFRAERARDRLAQVIGTWCRQPIDLLPLTDPDLSVARGAVAYGLSLKGRGPRIGGGTAHGFYVAVDAGSARRALSVLPRGAREGERHVARVPGLTLRVGEPVRFELFTLDDSGVDPPGAVVDFDPDRFVALPALSATFPADPGATTREVQVGIEGELSAIGTVDLGCIELDPPKHRDPRHFRLAFELRNQKVPDRPTDPPAHAVARVAGLAPRFDQATDLVLRVYGKSRADVKSREVRDLLRELERLLGERKTWTLSTNRALFDRLVADPTARRRSEDHERVFWMLAGFCLRPGFGHPQDPARIQQLIELFDAGIVHAQQTRVFQQFWIAWRRVAGGLSEPVQIRLRKSLDAFLAPEGMKLKRPRTLKALAPEELLELASWLERVPAERRAELGRWLIDKTWTKKDPRLWTALGRLGARIPAYASAHYVLPASVVESWLHHLLRERWAELSSAARAAFEMARVTGDRARDVGEALRMEVARELDRVSAPPEWSRAVRELVESSAAERADRFGEELPVGLRLSDA